MAPLPGCDPLAAAPPRARRDVAGERLPLGGAGQGAVVVAVAAMRVVQVAADQVVDVAAVRHRMVAARAAVLVAGIVAAARVRRRACLRIAPADRDATFVDVVVVRAVQVAVVQVVGVVVVPDGGVTTTRTVRMTVTVVRGMVCHATTLSDRLLSPQVGSTVTGEAATRQPAGAAGPLR
jgi:hypothetical protein